jgi:hypothetical protein
MYQKIFKIRIKKKLKGENKMDDNQYEELEKAYEKYKKEQEIKYKPEQKEENIEENQIVEVKPLTDNIIEKEKLELKKLKLETELLKLQIKNMKRLFL